MATYAISRDSDVVKYYYCTICEKERSEEVDADFYCETCLKYFCRTCINSHRQHEQSLYGKENIIKWPLSKKMENSLLTCDIHKDKQLTMYCPDHSELCCSRCVELNHRLCFRVISIRQACKNKSTNFKELSARTQNTLLQIKQFQTYQEGKMRSLKVSYNEHEKDIVEGMRLNINTFLHQRENCILNETQVVVQDIVNNMRAKIISVLENYFENSVVKKKKKELKLKQAPLMSVRNSCVRLQDELLQLHYAIQKVPGRTELSFIARNKCQEKILQSDTFLKENFTNHAFIVNGKSVHNVKMPSDSDTCWIEAICALPDGQVVAADNKNFKVKLLNQQYHVVSHWVVTAYIWGMCQITPSEIAVALNSNSSSIHEVQFFTVTQSQLTLGRKFELQHECACVAHNNGDLFVASGTALYKYSMSGELVCRLFNDTSYNYRVNKCAVSPTGDKLYITDSCQHMLLTLARDGTHLATFTDPALLRPSGLHVTPAGQVLVCGYLSDTIIQVDSEGRRNLAIQATRESDGVWNPVSVCYSSNTSCIIVGQSGDDNILVFVVE